MLQLRVIIFLYFVMDLYVHRGAQIFRRSGSLLKMMGAKRVAWNKFHPEGMHKYNIYHLIQLFTTTTWHQELCNPILFIYLFT